MQVRCRPREKNDGIRLLDTNTTLPMPGEALRDTELCQVEQTFQIAKLLLDIRPVNRLTAATIRA